MNLKMSRLKNGKEKLLFSNTKNWETLVKETHTKPRKILELELIKPRETFLFKPPISIEGSWMIRITSLGV